MARPKRPSHDATWCRETKQWLTPRDVGKLTKEFWNKAATSGHQEIEYIDAYGNVKEGILGGSGARSVNIDAYLTDADGALSSSLPALNYTDGAVATRVSHLEDEARFAIVARRDWVTVGVLSMLASGFKEREIERAMNIGRRRLRNAVSYLFGKYAG